MLKREESFPLASRDERQLDRRRLLCAAAGAVAAVALGEWAAKSSEARATAVSATVEAPAGLAIDQAESVVDSAGRETLVVRLDADTVVAFDRRCPHLGCPVLWSAQHGRFECPCHHAAFDARSGAVLFGPPRRGLAAVQVKA